MNVAAIILAAGSSQRLGRPKQNELLAGETLLQRAIRTASQAGFLPIIVVINEMLHCAVDVGRTIEFKINPNPDEGIASSIRCGIMALSSGAVAGALIMTCDQPAVTPAHLRSLCTDEGRMTGSRYARTAGVPAYFPKESFTALLQLKGNSGARILLQSAHLISAEGLELDIDTQQDLDHARALFESDTHEVS